LGEDIFVWEMGGFDIISNFVKGQDFIYGLLHKVKKETRRWVV
jgi:hypothetical protein